MVARKRGPECNRSVVVMVGLYTVEDVEITDRWKEHFEGLQTDHQTLNSQR